MMAMMEASRLCVGVRTKILTQAIVRAITDNLE